MNELITTELQPLKKSQNGKLYVMCILPQFKKKNVKTVLGQSYRSRLVTITGLHAIVCFKSLNEMKPLNEMNKMT